MTFGASEFKNLVLQWPEAENTTFLRRCCNLLAMFVLLLTKLLQFTTLVNCLTTHNPVVYFDL